MRIEGIFFVIARGSTYESYVIIDLSKMESEFIKISLDLLEEISKMQAAQKPTAQMQTATFVEIKKHQKTVISNLK